MIEIMLDHFARQLPDIDPTETKEWIDSLDAVVAAQGTPRARYIICLLYTSPSPRDATLSRMPSSA